MLLYDIKNTPYTFKFHSLSDLRNQLVPKLKSSMMDIFSIGMQNVMRLLIVVAGDCLLVTVRMSN